MDVAFNLVTGPASRGVFSFRWKTPTAVARLIPGARSLAVPFSMIMTGPAFGGAFLFATARGEGASRAFAGLTGALLTFRPRRPLPSIPFP
jgi:hypothetical protein